MTNNVTARGPVRRDHLLILAGGVVMTVGAALPWIRGSTRFSGYVDWTGLNDTGEGGMFVAGAVVLLAFVRWRGVFEEIEPRFRWTALVIGVAALLLWLISMQKALYLAWWEIEPGARPQIGYLVSLVGIVLTLAGGWLAARTRANAEVVARAARQAEEERRRRPSAPAPRVGADGYAVKGRLDSRGRNQG